MTAQLQVVLTAIWPSMLLGTGLVLIGTAAGWRLGRRRHLAGVRLVTWWLRRVIVPLLRARSFWHRAGTIFVNNICILAALLAIGVWPEAALIAIAGMGVSLGIALKRLAEDVSAAPLPELDARSGWRFGLGVVLNLLEPPAIVVTLGLCLGRGSLGSTSASIWGTFAVWVMPAILAAACGEALWLGQRFATGVLDIGSAPEVKDEYAQHPPDPTSTENSRLPPKP